MSVGYRNEMFEEMNESPEQVKKSLKQRDFNGKVVHCSQFQARSYLQQVGFRGIANNQKMQRLFRFALAAYEDDMFIGCSMVFLDIESPVVAFAVISTDNVATGAELLRKSEDICKIMGFSILKTTNKGFSKEFIRIVDVNRELNDRYSEGQGYYDRILH